MIFYKQPNQTALVYKAIKSAGKKGHTSYELRQVQGLKATAIASCLIRLARSEKIKSKGLVKNRGKQNRYMYVWVVNGN